LFLIKTAASSDYGEGRQGWIAFEDVPASIGLLLDHALHVGARNSYICLEQPSPGAAPDRIIITLGTTEFRLTATEIFLTLSTIDMLSPGSHDLISRGNAPQCPLSDIYNKILTFSKQGVSRNQDLLWAGIPQQVALSNCDLTGISDPQYWGGLRVCNLSNVRNISPAFINKIIAENPDVITFNNCSVDLNGPAPARSEEGRWTRSIINLLAAGHYQVVIESAGRGQPLARLKITTGKVLPSQLLSDAIAAGCHELMIEGGILRSVTIPDSIGNLELFWAKRVAVSQKNVVTQLAGSAIPTVLLWDFNGERKINKKIT